MIHGKCVICGREVSPYRSDGCCEMLMPLRDGFGRSVSFCRSCAADAAHEAMESLKRRTEAAGNAAENKP